MGPTQGYVTNINTEVMPAGEVIASYHDLWHVEQSFRMSKTDLRARPMFHRTRDAIEAHLTIVFTALAVSREPRTGPGWRSATSASAPPPALSDHRDQRRRETIQPAITTGKQAILDAIKGTEAQALKPNNRSQVRGLLERGHPGGPAPAYATVLPRITQPEPLGAKASK